MQIILMEQIHNLGRLGDIVKVKQGFARNYLIPKGKAKRATAANIAEFEQRRAELEAQQAKVLGDAKLRCERIDGMTLEITQKAGADGRLFGSVTHYDIAEALAAQGHEVPKSIIQMPGGPLKQTGDYQISVDFHADAIATITVTVVAEQ
jgi:large subunit ribosomal protein L9